jgi:subtilisin family serine protease
MKVCFVIIIFLSFTTINANNNRNEPKAVWVVMDQNVVQISGEQSQFSNNYELQKTLHKHRVISLYQSFPYSRNDYLRSIYTIQFDGDIDKFEKELIANQKTGIKNVVRIPDYEIVELYDPSDHMWQIDWLWHLKKIQADFAWDITKGSQNNRIAILDTWFDVNHPDLSQKLSTHFDPYSNTQFSSDCKRNHHGTTVASFAAAHTDGGGQLASVGFNSMIIPYQAWAGHYIERAHHASLAMNADVLTSSAGGWRCTQTTNEDVVKIEKQAVQEILDNGTIIVMPAGNGVKISQDGMITPETRCRPIGETMDRPWFPLSPLYDDRVIIVTSTDRNDNHTFIEDGVTYIHSHYPEVDICAPGYRVMGAQSTQRNDNGVCVANTWPYYGGYIGTSFATPLVAGVCALMKSVNPCLTPAQAKSIIGATADPVADANLFPGMVGAGRINAYNAVKMTGTRNIYNTTLTGTKIHSAGYGFNVANSSVGANSNISLKARIEVKIESSFIVPLESNFEVIIDAGAVNDCVAPDFEYSLNVNWVQMGPTGQLQFAYSVKNVSSSTKTFFLKGTANNGSMSTSTASHALSAGYGTGSMLPIEASTEPSNWKFYIREGDSNFTEANVVASGP